MLESSGNTINIDCVDPLGRTALLMAIDNENLEMVELLLENKVGMLFTTIIILQSSSLSEISKKLYVRYLF